MQIGRGGVKDRQYHIFALYIEFLRRKPPLANHSHLDALKGFSFFGSLHSNNKFQGDGSKDSNHEKGDGE